MAMAYGEESLGTPISVNGDTPRPRAMVFILGRMAIGTRESGNNV